MTLTLESARFHVRHAWFNIREQFADLRAVLASNAVLPFFVWLLSRVWERFNGSRGNFTLSEVVIYIGIGEVLYMTFVRPASISRASGDFSLALARPRSWLMTSFSGIAGRALGGRILMLLMLAPVLPALGADPRTVLTATIRFGMMLGWLTVLQGLVALLFASAQILWHQIDYFLLPVGKVFLVLGGVWGPICDFSEPWRSWLLRLPPSDLFFQPAYYCVKGEFYDLSAAEWIARTCGLALVLILANVGFFRLAKTRHQAFGG